MTLSEISKECPERGFTHMISVNEKNKKPWSLSFTILPEGPTL